MDLSKQSFQDLYLSYCQDMTDAPVKYHEAISYLILSCIVNKHVYMPFGHRKLYTNLYMLIVGASTLNRKSWAVDIGLDLVKNVYGYDYELPETSSRESLISELARPDRSQFGCGAIVIDELKGFIERIKRGNYHLGFLQDLSTMYDSKAIYRRKGVSEKEKEVYVVEEPYVSFVGCCSFDWLTSCIESSDFFGGFFARFVWIVHNESILNPLSEPGKANEEKKNMLLYKLERIKDVIGTCEWDNDSFKMYDVWYKTFRVETQDSIWDSNYERLTTIVKKIAMLNAISRMENEDRLNENKILISLEDLKSAIKFVTKTTSSYTNVIIAENKDDLLLRKVCQKVFKEKDISHSDLLHGVRGLNAEKLEKILKTMKQAELIEIEYRKTKDALSRDITKTIYHSNGRIETFLRS